MLHAAGTAVEYVTMAVMVEARHTFCDGANSLNPRQFLPSWKVIDPIGERGPKSSLTVLFVGSTVRGPIELSQQHS